MYLLLDRGSAYIYVVREQSPTSYGTVFAVASAYIMQLPNFRARNHRSHRPNPRPSAARSHHGPRADQTRRRDPGAQRIPGPRRQRPGVSSWDTGRTGARRATRAVRRRWDHGLGGCARGT